MPLSDQIHQVLSRMIAGSVGETGRADSPTNTELETAAKLDARVREQERAAGGDCAQQSGPEEKMDANTATTSTTRMSVVLRINARPNDQPSPTSAEDSAGSESSARKSQSYETAARGGRSCASLGSAIRASMLQPSAVRVPMTHRSGRPTLRDTPQPCIPRLCVLAPWR